MSAQDERGALPLPPALYDQALYLLNQSGDGVPPRRGLTLEQRPAASEAPLSGEEARNAIREALTPLPEDSATVHRRFARLGLGRSHLPLIRSAVADLPLPDDQREAARSLGRHLTRTGTARPAVTAGLALLIRLGEPEDIPYLRVLGLFREFTHLAVEALDILDHRRAAVVWLAVYARHAELRPLVRALWLEDRQAICTELAAFPAGPRFLSSTAARRIAEAARLPDLLDQRPSDTALRARAARLLARMGCPHADSSDLLAYRDARTVYECVASRASALPPALDNHALLLALALDLSSGPGVLLDWPAGRRVTLLESLGRLLATAPWASLPDTEAVDAG
ncbi:hypothetical protein ACFU99_04785, partial [Streptomyces sp. NPDC057654]